MEISWKFSIEDQIDRYIESALKVRTGFYQHHRFYLLPFMPEKFRNRVVFLPKTNFLLNLKTKNQKIKSEDKKEILKVCENILWKQKGKINKLEGDFGKTKHNLIPKLISKFPKSKNLSVTICPSFFGSLGSYELEKGKNEIMPRYDRKIKNIWQLLITALTHYYFYGHNACLNEKSKIWRQKQILAAKLHQELGFTDKPRGLVKILDNAYSAKLAKISSNYYKELGFPVNNKLSEIQSLDNLTQKEHLVLDLLIKKRNEIVSFDEMAEVLWKDDLEEKYSLYAITKLVERIRSKLKARGFEENLIHTQRGKGYLLFG